MDEDIIRHICIALYIAIASVMIMCIWASINCQLQINIASAPVPISAREEICPDAPKARDSMALSVPNVPLPDENDIPPTPRPVGVEISKTKVSRIQIRLTKVEQMFLYEEPPLEAIKHEINCIRAIFNSIHGLYPASLLQRMNIIDIKVRELETQKKCKCCVIM